MKKINQFLFLNFAFASTIQEMLIQSHTGVVKLFPVIPVYWKDAQFENLRTYSAFLVSSRMESGQVVDVMITSEKGGELILENPFAGKGFQTDFKFETIGENLVFQTQPDEIIRISSK